MRCVEVRDFSEYQRSAYIYLRPRTTHGLDKRYGYPWLAAEGRAPVDADGLVADLRATQRGKAMRAIGLLMTLALLGVLPTTFAQKTVLWGEPDLQGVWSKPDVAHSARSTRCTREQAIPHSRLKRPPAERKTRLCLDAQESSTAEIATRREFNDDLAYEVGDGSGTRNLSNVPRDRSARRKDPLTTREGRARWEEPPAPHGRHRIHSDARLRAGLTWGWIARSRKRCIHLPTPMFLWEWVSINNYMQIVRQGSVVSARDQCTTRA
jgi:hypothetical protein